MWDRGSMRRQFTAPVSSREIRAAAADAGEIVTPDKYFNYAKSGGSSGKSKNILVLAVTCCDCKHYFCFCVGFVEPFEGQPFLKCIYDSDRSERPAT